MESASLKIKTIVPGYPSLCAMTCMSVRMLRCMHLLIGVGIGIGIGIGIRERSFSQRGDCSTSAPAPFPGLKPSIL